MILYMVMILGLAGILIFFKHSYQVNTRFYSTLNRVPTDAVSTFIINIISAHLSYVAIIKF